jgi:hypothetical protein
VSNGCGAGDWKTGGMTAGLPDVYQLHFFTPEAAFFAAFFVFPAVFTVMQGA